VSVENNLRLAPSHETSYTVTQRDGCTLMFGQIPVTAFIALHKAASNGQVVSPHLARLAKATFAYGPPGDVAALIRKLTHEHTVGYASASGSLSPPAVKWLAVGEHGTSSATMFWKFTGIRAPYVENEDAPRHHPHDVDDFRRCRLLLEQVPGFVHQLDRMRAVSPVWDRLVSAWPELCALMDAEAPHWRDGAGSAELTHERIIEIIGSP
jgi:hypothetical protein